MLDTGANCPFCDAAFGAYGEEVEPVFEVIAKKTAKKTPRSQSKIKKKVVVAASVAIPPPKPTPRKKRPPVTSAPASDITEFLTQNPNKPNEVRLKRTERKKKAGITQKVLQRALQSLVAVATIIIGVLIASSFFTAGKIISGNEITEPAPVLAPQAGSESKQAILRLEESTDAAETVRACFRSRTVGEMLPYIRNSEEVQPLMEAWYQRFPLEPAELGKTIRQKKIEVSEGQHMIMLAMEVPGGSHEFFAVEKLSDGSFKVDWPVSSGYQEMPLEDFQNETPSTPVPFRVKAKSSDYYNYVFVDSAKYQCVELYYPGDDSFRLYGYIDRQNPETSVLLSKLAFGSMSLILNLRYPEESPKPDQVEIVSLISADWF
jgi:hypothetical protein